MNPSQSLRRSADTFSRIGQFESARMARRMSEDATVWPELYADWAEQLAARAEKLTKLNRGVGTAQEAPASSHD